jgi:predicted dehydrogenase
MAFKIGLLGMWHTHTAGLVRQVAEHPQEFALVGGYDADPKVVRDRQQQWEKLLPGGLRVFDTPADLLRQEPDGVAVEGRVHDNLRLARLALEAGRPVLLEKPAGTDRDEHRRLIDLARRKHLRVQMLYLFRYMPAVQELLKRARAGGLGRAYLFRARLPKDLPSYARFVDELRPYKGGMFFEMAGHVVDVMVALLGQPKAVTPFLAHHHTQPPAAYIDNGVAVFGYEHAWGVVEVAALEAVPHSRRVEAYGTQGACVIPHLGSGHLPNKDVQLVEACKAGDADWQRLELPAQPLHLRDLREFVACVQGKKAPDFDCEHDLAVQETLLRASGML